MGQAGWKGFCLSLFDYKTEKYVVAKNKKVGLLYRLLQLSILLYLVVWVFVVKKGYQDVDTSLQSAVVTKVKGVAYTNTSELGERLWDVADYVIPPQGDNVFVVITNLIVTTNQRQGTCAEYEGVPDGLCSQDYDCHAGESVIAGNGVKTGRCLRVGNSTRGTCEIFAWCPVETQSMPMEPLLKGAEDFTIFVKNFIRFPKFNFSKANVQEDKNFLKSCRFSPKNLYCPIFRLGSVIRWAGSNFQDIAMKGGVIAINIEWDCDLDKAASECNPRYYFSRLDNNHVKSVSSGYNFRFARYYRDSAGAEFRTLIKAFGIRFDVIVNGKAGKFSIIPTIINLGSGVALMGAGAFFCDLVLIYIIKKREFYRDKKYEEVSRSLKPARQRGARPGRRPCCWRNEGSCASRPAPPVSREAPTGQGREGSTLEAEAKVAEPGQPEEELLEEQPQALPRCSHWKGNGSVCSQFPELARSGLLKNVKVNAEQLQTLQTVET